MMEYSTLEIDFFLKFLKNEFPKIYDFVNNSNLISIEEVMALVNGIKRVDDDEAIEKTEIFLREQAADNSQLKVCFYPAGGIGKDIGDICRKLNIDVEGFIDTQKASGMELYDGYPVYNMDDIFRIGFDKLIILSSAYADEIYEGLDEATRTKTFVPFLKDTIDKDKCNKYIKAINDICSQNSNKMSVAFAVEALQVNYLKRIKLLKEQGVITILITAMEVVRPAFDFELAHDSFDYVCSLKGNVLNQLYIIQNITPDVVHLMPVMLHFKQSLLSQVIAGCKVVSDFRDILSNAHNESTLAPLVGEKFNRQLFDQEKYLFNHSSGIIYKENMPMFKTIQKKYNSNKPSLQFQAYIPRHAARNNSLNGSKPQKIVFAGGLENTRAAGGDVGVSIFDYIEVLSSQGFSFDIYNAYDNGDDAYVNYKQKETEISAFKYHKPVPNNVLADVLSHYDFGWLVFDLRGSFLKEEHYYHCMTDKFFDYLSAGLPLIILDQYKYMCEIVEYYNIGVIVSYETIPKLNQLVEDNDISQMKKNVQIFQNDYQMEKHITRLIDFYHSL